MGMTADLICPACGYKAHVSGGGDCGFDAATQTIVCLDCKELHDVLVSTGHMTKKIVKIPLACPKSAEHKWKKWKHPGPCPRCGKTMEQDPEGTTTMWD